MNKYNTALQYCKEKLQHSHSSFYYSFLFLPAEKKVAMTVLYAFCREVDDIVDNHKDTAIAKLKLQWWHTEITSVFQQQRAQHPITQALLPLLSQYPFKQQYFHELLSGMEMDLTPCMFTTLNELEKYCYHVAGTVGLLSIAIFGYYDKATEKYATELALSLQLINILRDIKEDLQRNRLYLPQILLQRFAVTEKMLHQSNNTVQTHALFTFITQMARQHYHQALHYLSDTDRTQQRSALIMANIYHALLDKIEQQHFPVLQYRVRLSGWKKLWIAWSTARNETCY